VGKVNVAVHAEKQSRDLGRGCMNSSIVSPSMLGVEEKREEEQGEDEESRRRRSDGVMKSADASAEDLLEPRLVFDYYIPAAPLGERGKKRGGEGKGGRTWRADVARECRAFA